MMLLTAIRDDARVDIVVVLDKENLERIEQYDPVEIVWQEYPWRISSRLPGVIALAFATPVEQKVMESMVREGKIKQAIELVCRGFQYRPDKGDHDEGPELLGRSKA